MVTVTCPRGQSTIQMGGLERLTTAIIMEPEELIAHSSHLLDKARRVLEIQLVLVQEKFMDKMDMKVVGIKCMLDRTLASYQPHSLVAETTNIPRIITISMVVRLLPRVWACIVGTKVVELLPALHKQHRDSKDKLL